MSHSASLSSVSDISDVELEEEFALPGLTTLIRTKTKHKNFQIADEIEMRSKILSKLKPIQRQVLGEYFASALKFKDNVEGVKIFSEWFVKYRGKLESAPAVGAALDELKKLGYTLDGGVLYLPPGKKYDAHHELLSQESHTANVEYNDWNDYDYQLQDSFYPIHQFGGYKSSKYIDGTGVSGYGEYSGYTNYYIVLGVLVTLMLCTLCAAIVCICGGTFGFIAGKFHKKQNQFNEKRPSVFEEV